MTERRPPGMPYESWIDRQIREAEERGEFDDLPGAGKPLPDLDQPRDELWWVKRLVRREGIRLTPDTLALRRDIERAREDLASATSEAEVRAIVASLNRRIRNVNARPASGPPSNVAPLDAEAWLESWRDRHRGSRD